MSVLKTFMRKFLALFGNVGFADKQFRQEFAHFHLEKYQRPYGTNAPWNLPVKHLPQHPESALYAERLWQDAPDHWPGNFKLTFDDYTYPVYYVHDALGRFPVQTTWETNINGKTIPWNPIWRPPDGTDAQIIILDLEQGLEWNLWQVEFRDGTIWATNGNLVQVEEERGDGSNPANLWQKENGFRPSRGIGVQYLAMLVRPEEIMLGEIRHALSMPIRNTDGALFVAPATKLEHPSYPSDQIPEGMRFALKVTDKEIDLWLASLPKEFSAVSRYSARCIAVALRDYGWFITDTSGAAHL
ncbi:MAG: hypothetical protein D3923_14755, partial [Candidatus Electrothrix sp. AR3]|nr:hypothetical protein [Candidatus Electrothrix sp. AR3]